MATFNLDIIIRGNSGNAEKSLDEVDKEIRAMEESIRELDRLSPDEMMRRLGLAAKDTGQDIGNMDVSLDSARGTTDGMERVSHALYQTFNNVDNSVTNNISSFNVLGRTVAGAGDAMGAFGEIATGALRRVGEMAVDAAVNGIGSFVDGVGSAIGIGIEYGDAMNMMGAVSGATGDQMAEVGRAAKALGNDVTLPGTSASDAAAAMVELARAGMSVEEAMAAADGVLRMSAAGGIENAQAAEYAANALNSFGLEADRATMVADLFAATANASSVEVADVADAMNMASAVFGAFQGPALGAEGAMVTLTTAISLLGNAGIKGSDAGTSLKQSLLMLVKPADDTKILMGDLAASIGLSGDLAYTADGQMRPFNDILGILARSTAAMTEEQRNATVAQIFGADASRAIITLMQAGPEAFDSMTAAVTRQGAANELAGAKMQGLGGAVEGFQSAMETAKLVAIEPFMPLIERLARVVTDAIGQMPIESWATNAAAAITPLAAIIEQYIPPVAAKIVDAATAFGTLYNTVQEKIPGVRAFVEDAMTALSTAFNLAKDALEPLTTALKEGGLSGAVALVKEKVPGLTSVIDTLRPSINTLKDAAQTLTDKFRTEGLAGALSALPGEFSNVLSSVNTMRTDLASLALNGVGGLLEKLKDSSGFTTFLSNLGLSKSQINDVGTVTTNAGTIFKTMGQAVQDLGKWFSEKLGPALAGAAAAFGSSLSPRVAELSTVFATQILPIVRDVAGVLGTVLVGAINILMPILAGLANIGLAGLVVALRSFADYYQSTVKPSLEAWGNLLRNLTGGWEQLGRGAERVREIMGGLASGISGMAGPFSNAMSSMFGGTGGGGGSWGNTFSDNLNNAMRRGKEAVSNWFGEFKKSGEWLIVGIKDGMIGKIGWLVDEVRNGLQAVIDAVKDLFRIGSPSKVMEEFGGYISQGLAGGITTDLPDVVGAANEMGQAAMPNISGGTAPGAAGSGAAGGVTLTINVAGSVLSERELTQVVLDGLKEYQSLNLVTGIR